MSDIQKKADKNAQETTNAERDLEAHVLTQAARRLGESLQEWQENHDSGTEKLSEALRNNQRLWTVFQSELSSADNPLPLKMKEDLLNLSLFVDKRTFEMMENPDPEKIKILIDINMNIAAGLQGSGNT